MRICEIEGCGGKHKGNGYCSKHWQRYKAHGDPLGGGPERERTTTVAYRPKGLSVEESFRYFLPDPPPEQGPWYWPGPRDDNGYGCFVVGGKRMFAHRVSYELFVGPIPKGRLVRHDDDVPLNIHPSNLQLGTWADNRQDAVNRNRQARGMAQGLSRLKDEDVVRIRDEHARGVVQANLAAKYAVSTTTISNIVLGRTWRHLPDGSN